MKNPLFIGLSLIALAACGNDRRENINLDIAREFFRSTQNTAISPDQTATLVSTALRVLNEPVMLAILEQREAAAILVPLGQNGPVETWTTEERQLISFHNGVITATRGLGFDLMSADVQSASRAIRAGQGTVNRTWRTINASNEVLETVRQCTVSGAGAERTPLASGVTVDTRRVVERCGNGIENQYWLSSDGTIVQSRQWVSADLGYVTQQLLRR